jgi:ClpP class serine protease
MNRLVIPEAFSNYLLSTMWAIDIEYGMSFLSKVLYSQSMGIRQQQPAPFSVVSDGGVTQIDSLSSMSSGSMLRLRYSGAMVTDDQVCGQDGIQTLSDRMYAAYSSKNVSGILLELNSGGGEGLSADILGEVMADRNKPVVIRTHILGSAAVKGAVQADEIIASNANARIGSIGAFFSVNKSFVTWYQENMDDIYATTSQDKNLEFRAYLEGDKMPMKKLIDKYDSDFKGFVSTHRSLKGSAATVKETLSGGMFEAADAKSRGLIDGIGGLSYAVKRLQSHIRNFKS